MLSINSKPNDQKLRPQTHRTGFYIELLPSHFLYLSYLGQDMAENGIIAH